MTDTVNTRAIVLNILVDVMEKGNFSHITIRRYLDKNAGLDRQERAFVTRLAEGTIEKTIELDYIINSYAKIKVKKMKPVIRNILRMSIYQLKYMDSVPESAVCNEAVKLAAKRGFVNLKGFVNGILRSYIRNKDKVVLPDIEKDKVAYYSIVYSVPEWIVKLWIEEYGTEKTEKMLSSNKDDKAVCIRRNASIASEKTLIDELEKQSVKAVKSDVYDGAFYISGYEKISDLQAFEKGYFQVQDISSMMTGLAASPRNNDYCVDVCAAPGGKTIHLADMLNGTGVVVSRDLTEEKISMIEQNVKRCGFENISVNVWDATKYDENLKEKADVLIADLPCSGLGVMARKSDIKYKVTYDSIVELAELQRKILSVVADYVKPGGILIFSTCTVNHLENDENVKWILENLPFESESLEGILPECFESDRLKSGMLQIYPGEYDMDGFFISRFRKTER